MFLFSKPMSWARVLKRRINSDFTKERVFRKTPKHKVNISAKSQDLPFEACLAFYFFIREHIYSRPFPHSLNFTSHIRNLIYSLPLSVPSQLKHGST